MEADLTSSVEMTGTARGVDVIRDKASEDVVDDGGKGESEPDTVGESMGMGA